MAAPTVSVQHLRHPVLRNDITRVPHMPGLDGLRALAVVCVMVYHANHTWLRGGFLGVEVFFVISGYLITLLLVGEGERTGTISLRRFWMRRARRLLPALFVMMAGLAVYTAVFRPRALGQTRGDFIAGLLYSSNWFQIAVGHAYTAAESFAPMRHLWSLAVEEQFYLFWPLVMLVLMRRNRQRLTRLSLWLLGSSVAITLVMAAMFVSGTVYLGADTLSGAPACGPGVSHGYLSVLGRCINVDEALYLGTISRAGGLMLGSAFALVWRPFAILRGPLRWRARRVDLVAALGLVGLGVLVATQYLFDEVAGSYNAWLFRGGFFLTGLCTVAVLSGVSHRRAWTGRILGIRPLHWIGRRSYGLYLYHWPVIQAVREPGRQLTASQFAVAMAITVAIAELSHRYVEMPVRLGRLGEWMRGQRPPRTVHAARRRRRFVLVCLVASGLTVYAGVRVAIAELRCEGQVACDSERGAAAIAAAVESPPVLTPPETSAVTTTTISPLFVTNLGDGLSDVSTTSTSTTTTYTLPPGPADLLPPVAVGESVMLGAAPQLQAGGFVVNAAVSRQVRNVEQVVASMRAAGQIGRVVVIQTGTNGLLTAESLDRIMTYLPDTEVLHVVFLTVKAPRGWVETNNALIRELPERYRHVRVLEWDKAALMLTDELSRSDGGIHLSTEHAKQVYANLIFEAIGRPDLQK